MAWSKPQKPVCLVLLLLTNQLAGFFAPIPFRFAYFCHAFPVNKYPRNSPRHSNLACWIINLLLDVLLCSIADYYMANTVLGKSLCSDWFFLGQEFAVRTVSMETVQPVYFVLGRSRQIQNLQRKQRKKKNVGEYCHSSQ